MQVTAIIVAAGKGERFGGPVPKQFIELGGKPVLYYALAAFQEHPLISEIIVAAPVQQIEAVWQQAHELWHIKKLRQCVAGGQYRHESVMAGLPACSKSSSLVAIHDGVRPLLSAQLISRVIKAAQASAAAIPALAPRETIKIVEAGIVLKTLARASLVAVQTPQVFARDLLVAAYEKAVRDGFHGTDDAAVVENYGAAVHVVQGDPENIKITSPEDLATVKMVLRKRGFPCE
jgi:2-C-methyl-D-erythritol 4-phosphate cytidylyltransferase